MQVRAFIGVKYIQKKMNYIFEFKIIASIFLSYILLKTILPKSQDKSLEIHVTRLKFEDKNSTFKTKTPKNSELINFFSCPQKSEILSPPNSCPRSPTYPAYYNSSLFPIYPVFNPGPSEQNQGFKQTILAAGLLGKSIIFSNFTIHRLDALSKSQTVPVGVRVDLEKLCNFISIKRPRRKDGSFKIEKLIIVSQMRPKKFEWELSTAKRFVENYSKGKFTFEIDLNMTGLGETNTSSTSNIHFLPSSKFQFYPDNPATDLKLWFHSKNLTYDFGTSQKVIGLAHPYNWIFQNHYKLIDSGGAYRFKNPVYGESNPPNFSNFESMRDLRFDKNLLKKVYMATSHPKFIRDLADLFIRSEIGPKEYLSSSSSSFISLHWRFNPGDFLSPDFLTIRNESEVQGRRGVDKPAMLNLHKSLNNMTFLIEKLINHVERKDIADPPKTILITSPPGILHKINEKDLSNFQYHDKKYKILTTENSINFLKNFMDCWVIEKYFGDVLSTFEKEVVLRSEIFYRARPSNWSFNTQGHRFAEFDYDKIKFDGVVYDVFERRRK